MKDTVIYDIPVISRSNRVYTVVAAAIILCGLIMAISIIALILSYIFYKAGQDFLSSILANRCISSTDVIYNI